MKVICCNIPDVLIIEPKVFGDDRGFFFESFNQIHFKDIEFVQDNHSCSAKNVLRGLHYQLVKPQGKLVRVVRGAVIDVVVDIRKSSPTFKQWVSVKLTANNFKQLWVPPGFAHGFITLEDNTEVLYKTTDYWYREHERSIRWNDPELGIDWQNTQMPDLSNKDVAALFLHEAEIYD